MRIYDPRVGRFLSLDPLQKNYPELTPYQFASNRPIDGIDQDGLEWAPTADPMAMQMQYYHVARLAQKNGEDPVQAVRSHANQTLKWQLKGINFAGTGMVLVAQPEVGVPLAVTYITGAPATPSPQAMSTGVTNQAVRQAELVFEEVATEAEAATQATPKITNGGVAAKVGPSLKTAGGKTINNSKWANQFNPGALSKGYQVPVKSNGYPDFSKYLYTKAPASPGTVQSYNTVTIQMTGTYAGDFAAANKLAGFTETPAGFTWNHTEVLGEMQLVERNAHEAARHSGGVQLYKEAHGGRGYK